MTGTNPRSVNDWDRFMPKKDNFGKIGHAEKRWAEGHFVNVFADTISGVHAASHIDGTDDIQNATAAQKGLMTSAYASKLDGIEAGADVTDAANVNASGATMNADTDVSGNSWVLDEDNLGSNSAVKVPTQQSVKAYIDNSFLFKNVLYPDPSATDQGAVDATYDSVKDLIDAIGSTEKATLVFRHNGATSTTTYVFLTSETITSNITVIMEPGAVISVATGVIVTIQGAFSALPVQCFSLTGTGKVVFGTTISRMMVEWWGATGDNSTDCTSAIIAALVSADESGSAACDVRFLSGIYRTSGDIDLGGMDKVSIVGEGVDATTIRCTSATNNVFKWTSTARWQVFEDFTIDCSTTKTAGAHFYASSAIYRARFENLKLKDWYDGIKLDAFEECRIIDCQIAEPDAAGAAIIIGKAAGSAQGANLYIRGCFLRGTDGTDGVGGSNVATYGVYIYDADAVFMENTDIGGFIQNDLIFNPTTRSHNHHFTQCFFDSTKTGDCILFVGAGTKIQNTFTGCWVASAGQETSGSDTAKGINIPSSYGAVHFNWVGGRVFNCKGNGIDVQASSPNITFTGVWIESNGQGAQASNRWGAYISTGLNNTSVSFKSCHFVGASDDGSIYYGANSRQYFLVDNNCDDDISDNGIGYLVINNTENGGTPYGSWQYAANYGFVSNNNTITPSGSTGIGFNTGGVDDRMVITSGGTVVIAGTLTSGGADPPYELFWAETRESVVERIKRGVPPKYLNGCAIFYNTETDMLETFKPSTGQFRDFIGNVLAEIVPITDTFEVERIYFINTETGKLDYREQKKDFKEYRLKSGFKIDQETGTVKSADGKVFDIIDAVERLTSNEKKSKEVGQ